MVISLTLETSEPSFDNLPGHLDPRVPDDRILASTLAIQARFPSATVALVARDLNIQNKAHVLGLPFAEPPEQAAPKRKARRGQGKRPRDNGL